jgi:hypothetical protein
MTNTTRIALLLTAMCVAGTGCATGVVDGDEAIDADGSLVIEAWDGDATPADVVTAEAYEGREMVGELPPVTPEIIDEASACDAIIGTYHAQGLEIGCATTTHVCPDMLRFAFGQACLQYQASSVQACTQRIRAATTCDELWTMSCNVVPVPDSAPAGCPADAVE